MVLDVKFLSPLLAPIQPCEQASQRRTLPAPIISFTVLCSRSAAIICVADCILHVHVHANVCVSLILWLWVKKKKRRKNVGNLKRQNRVQAPQRLPSQSLNSCPVMRESARLHRVRHYLTIYRRMSCLIQELAVCVGRSRSAGTSLTKT